MNISYNWLKELIDIDYSADELGKKLTSVGLAVEGIHQHGDDLVLDIDLTSNRPDCLSHLGIAREIGAIDNSSVRVNERSGRSHDPIASFVSIECPELCHRFTARIINNVKIGPSPKWLVDRLEAIGERSINNVADITNYVMHELGQPMHSFDLDQLAGNRILVRNAKQGESITTLDEEDRKLEESMVVVCDIEKPAAIGGVMGGLDSSITEATSNVLLEVAYFERKNIRTTSRRLNLATEASYRFERGVDIDKLEAASNRATELICELAGGDPGDYVDVYPTRRTAKTVSSADISAAVKRLTGLVVSSVESLRILDSLGITAQDPTDSQTFIVPSWRHDIHIEEDLVEEVARHTGYHNIGSELPPAFGAGEYQPTEYRERRLRQALIDTGFDEALSYSFIDTKYDGIFEVIPGLVDESLEEPYVTLQDSVIEGAIRMRPSQISGLLEAVRLNLNHQRRDIKIFEIGKVFASADHGDGLPNEQKSFALVVTGGEVNQGRAMVSRQLDFFDAKGAVEAALEAAGIVTIGFEPVEVKHLRAGQSAAIVAGDTTIGFIGRLNDDISVSYKFKQPVYVAELNLSLALAQDPVQVTYKPMAKFPGVVRDVSFIVDRKTQFETIRSSIIRQGNELCRNVSFVDIYEGKGLEGDERSITIRLEYRSDERTLIEEEIEILHSSIIGQIENDLAIKTRF